MPLSMQMFTPDKNVIPTKIRFVKSFHLIFLAFLLPYSKFCIMLPMLT